MSSVTSTTNSTGSLLGALGSSYQLPQAAQARGRTELSQDQFLQLMLTQFKNQDPLKPQDPTEFLSQLAQVSSVAGISEMNKSMARLADATYAAQALQASAVVGRDVLAPSASVAYSGEQAVRGRVDLPVATATGLVRILDSSGTLVREMPLGSRAAGAADFQWDGRSNTGVQMPPGVYHVGASYSDGENEVALDTYLAKRVASVALGGDGQRTEITTDDGEKIGLGDILAIY